ncbi:nuclear migration protein nudC, partial [Thraustotheca clavata]
MSARYDDVLMAVVQQEGSIKGLLHAFFDFLHRKTDLYVVSDNPKRSMGFAPGQAQNLVLNSFQSFPMKPIEDVQPQVAAAPHAQKEKKTSTRSQVEITEEGKQVPVGNGGFTDKYTWTQSLQDLTVSIPIPKGTKSKDLNVKFTQSTLCVKMKGKDEPVVEGKFGGKIKVEDSLWSLESNEALVVSLEKAAPKT